MTAERLEHIRDELASAKKRKAYTVRLLCSDVTLLLSQLDLAEQENIRLKTAQSMSADVVGGLNDMIREAMRKAEAYEALHVRAASEAKKKAL